MNSDATQLLHETRRTLADAETCISHAVEVVEQGRTTDIEELLGETLARIKILDAEIRRFLDGPE